MTLSPAQQYLQEFSQLAQSRTWTERDSIVVAMEELFSKISHDGVKGGGELKLMGQWCFGFLKLYGEQGKAIKLESLSSPASFSL